MVVLNLHKPRDRPGWLAACSASSASKIQTWSHMASASRARRYCPDGRLTWRRQHTQIRDAKRALGTQRTLLPPNPLGPIIAEERTRANYIIVNCAYQDRNLQQQSAYGLLARKGWPTRYAGALMLKSSITWCKLRWIDSARFIWLYRRCPRILDAISIVRPETVVRWHRKGLPLICDGSAERERIPARQAERSAIAPL